jgi:hypothetical protein
MTNSFVITLSKTSAAVLLLAILAFTTQAQTIFDLDFDGGYSGVFTTASYGNGNPLNTGNTILSSGGNPNGCYQVTMTTTTWNDYYAGQLFLYTVAGNTDINPSDYVLSFDANGSQAANIEFVIQTWQGNWGSGPALMVGDVANEPLTAANTWQNFSVNLGAFADGNPTGGTWQLTFQLNSSQWNGPANTDTLTVDNIALTVVPEPTTLTLVGLGTVGLLTLRRQKA